MPRRRILVADGSEADRKALVKLLASDYDVLAAGEVGEALNHIDMHTRTLSAAIVDLPLMGDGSTQILQQIRKSPTLSSIPFIVVSAEQSEAIEEDCLGLGVNDYIRKPYNAKVLKYRIDNAIKMRERSAFNNMISHDRLTHLSNRDTFLQKILQMVMPRESGHYVLACIDIDEFKVINDQYGNEMGDRVLKHVAKCLTGFIGRLDGACARISADTFAVLYPTDYMDSKEIYDEHQEMMAPDCLGKKISIRIGRYIVDDLALNPAAMYDRAALAQESVRGRYDAYIATYDEAMRSKHLSEQVIVAEMWSALEQAQFEIHLQPQYNHMSGAWIGAEVLVRWAHPKRGIMCPDDFIPIFERNGFIYEMDKCVWEQSCILLKKWLDAGLDPLPLSVNISRYDLFRWGFYETITGLVERYEIPVELLRLEVTETAFMEAPEAIVEVVQQLDEYGFTIEIDDFGSGYSSLNTLKDVPAHVLKLDMKFLGTSKDTRRGGNIVESVVRMAKWLDMPVIAEGVETVEQADYLKSIGCIYVQGYLYAKPMPITEYEKLVLVGRMEMTLTGMETVDGLDTNDFWDPNSIDTLIFNSYVGAACIIEYYNDDIELLRANDKFTRSLDIEEQVPIDVILSMRWKQHLDAQGWSELKDAIEQMDLTGDMVVLESVFIDLPGCAHETFVRLTMRIIARTGDRYLVYCIAEGMTRQRAAERHEKRLTKQMQAIMSNVNSGIIATAFVEDRLEFLFANDHFFDLVGYSREDFSKNRLLLEDYIYPDDVEMSIRASHQVRMSREPKTIVFRIAHPEKGARWARASISYVDLEEIEGSVQLSVINDITEERENEIILRHRHDSLSGRDPDTYTLFRYNLSREISLRSKEGSLLDIEFDSDGKTFDERTLEYASRYVHPYDRKNYIAFLDSEGLRAAYASGTCNLAFEYQEIMPDSRTRLLHVSVELIPYSDSDEIEVFMFYEDVTMERKVMSLVFPAIMEYSNDLAFVKDQDFRYLYCSRIFLEMVGAENQKDVIGKTDYEIFSEEVASRFRTNDYKLVIEGTPAIDLMEMIPAVDGTFRYYRLSKYPLSDTEGRNVGVYGIGQDVTESRETLAQLELLANNVPCGLATFVYRDGALKIVYANDGFCEITGLSRAELLQADVLFNLGHMVFERDETWIEEGLREMFESGASLERTLRLKTGAGGYCWVNTKGVRADKFDDSMLVNVLIVDVTEQQRLVEELHMSEEGRRLAIEHTGGALAVYDIAGKTLMMPSNLENDYGIPSLLTDVPRKQIDEGWISEDTADACLELCEAINRGTKTGTARWQLKLPQGWRWIETRYTTIFANEQPVSAAISFIDITGRLEHEAIYNRWQQSLDERSDDSYMLFRCNLSKNASYDTVEGSLLNVRFDQTKVGFDDRTDDYVLQCVFDDDVKMYREFMDSGNLLAHYYRGERSRYMEYREKTDEGSRWLSLSVDLMEYPASNDIAAYLMYEDIDERKRAELLVIERAERDALTNAYNRVTFASKMQYHIELSGLDVQHALLLLDIDNFKRINDTFGHGTGDEVLVELTRAVQSILRSNDLIGRLGGDEFVVFLNDIPGEDVVSEKANRICELTRQIKKQDLNISCSIGIAMVPRDGSDFETLYRNADLALYAMKDSEKGAFAFYDASRDATSGPV